MLINIGIGSTVNFISYLIFINRLASTGDVFCISVLHTYIINYLTEAVNFPRIKISLCAIPDNNL